MRLVSGLFIVIVVTGGAHAQPAAFERCVACHTGKSTGDDVGPNLSGVFGRKAGSREDFRYSRPLLRSGIVWDERNLDAFLKAPDQLIPGTRMPFEWIASDTERAQVIEHLKTLK